MTRRDQSDALVDRRQFLRGTMALGSGWALSDAGGFRLVDTARATSPAGSDLGAVRHVIFVMQENRSFDHYFGAYKGVAGFDDHPSGDLGAFAQTDPANTTRAPLGEQLPFHLDSRSGLGECTHDLNHGWLAQHQSWNGGAMDGFISTHTAGANEGATNGRLTMGYYRRGDLPFHYALADAFTICDHYFCSVLGPTHPNRLMAVSGSIDPAGTHGGPVLTTNPSRDILFSARWTSVPELLEDAGVSWKSYTTPGQGFVPSAPGAGFGDAILQYFAAFAKPSSSLFRRAFLPTYPGDFLRDVQRNTLPSVSWITPPNGFDEHPPAPPANGARFLSQVLATLVAHPTVWARTVLFVTYDENGGFFDHVTPPSPPPGTTGEFVTASPLPSTASGVAGPIGLGARVPMLVVSPFSRGGYLSAETFDHTSLIRFLEARFGIRSHEISAWRRATVGNLVSTLRPGPANLTRPRLPATTNYPYLALTTQGCTPDDVAGTNTSFHPYPLPSTQVMATQEPGTLHRLSP